MATCYSRRVSARNRRGGIRTNPRTNEWVQMGTKKAKRNLLLSSSRGKKCARVHSVQFQKGKGENEFRQEALRPSALLSFDSNKRPLRWLINGLTEREVGTIAFPLNLGQCPNAPSDESTNSCSPVFLSFPFFSSLLFFFLSFFPSSQTSRMVENWFSPIELSSSLSWFFRRWWIHYSVKKEENEQKSGTPPWRWKVSRGTGDRDTAKSVYRAAVLDGDTGPRVRIFVARFHDGGRDLWCMKGTEHKMCTGMHPPLLRASRPLQRKCRTLMTLMRLFWRLFVSLWVPLFHFSPMQPHCSE